MNVKKPTRHHCVFSACSKLFLYFLGNLIHSYKIAHLKSTFIDCQINVPLLIFFWLGSTIVNPLTHINDAVFIQNDQVKTDSLKIADILGKKHKDVLCKIENLERFLHLITKMQLDGKLEEKEFTVLINTIHYKVAHISKVVHVK